MLVNLEAAQKVDAMLLLLDAQHESLRKYYSDKFGFLEHRDGDARWRMFKATAHIDEEMQKALAHDLL
ncbi:Uncharacterised protein [Trueperella bialowiezensis]|uniref:Uncharacterized protein n=2 Tax=Trueperella bialowiezensis TaxID=312285 RepID=A0A448PD69_9ACTO|nr:Uncharacterised protein [Trueperella bialowiezensis]